MDGSGQYPGGLGARIGLPDSGQQQQPLQQARSQAPALHLPQPRSITPISLGFNVPESQASSSGHVDATSNLGSRQPNSQAGQAAPPSYAYAQSQSPGSTSLPTSRERSSASAASMNNPERTERSTSSEWEILSDAESRMNEGDHEVKVKVEELEKVVEKRRSNYQYLETELAALDAQLKAADERLAQAKNAGGSGVVTGSAGQN